MASLMDRIKAKESIAKERKRTVSENMRLRVSEVNKEKLRGLVSKLRSVKTNLKGNKVKLSKVLCILSDSARGDPTTNDEFIRLLTELA